jgi:chorismate dehydratase
MHGNQYRLFDLNFSSPSRCADLLACGKVEVGLLPVVEYQRLEKLKIVPGLSIACKNQVKSVILASKCPVQDIRTIAADTSSRTSLCLLEILLREQYGIAPKIVPHPPRLGRMLEKSDAALIIGDIALQTAASDLQIYDLASEWRTLTGKPFVFAFWAARVDLLPSETAAFIESYRFGMDNLDKIVAAQTVELGLDSDVIKTYLTQNINYALDVDNLAGLQLFYQLALKHRLIQIIEPLKYLC